MIAFVDDLSLDPAEHGGATLVSAVLADPSPQGTDAPTGCLSLTCRQGLLSGSMQNSATFWFSRLVRRTVVCHFAEEIYAALASRHANGFWQRML